MTETKQAKATPDRPGRTRTAPILVGFDDSDGGRDALELARLLSDATGARCEVGTCLLYGPISVGRAISDEVDADVEPLFETARRVLGDQELRTHVVGARSPGRMLIECAERIGAGTLVVGSPHRGGLGRAILGSVAERVLHHAPCEVVVAPAGFASIRHERIAKVAVAYDGTEESKAALGRAEEIARSAGAAIEILVAEDPVVAGVEAVKDEEQQGAEHLTSAAAVLAEGLEAIDPTLEAGGKELDPGWRQVVSQTAEAIAAACRADVDLLVAGTRSSGERAMLGSVTKHLIHLAPCPVLVVPRD